ARPSAAGTAPRAVRSAACGSRFATGLSRQKACEVTGPLSGRKDGAPERVMLAGRRPEPLRMTVAPKFPKDRSVAGLTLEGAGVWLVVPCFKVRDQILRVIAGTPSWFEG